jgi:hypothetical protein
MIRGVVARCFANNQQKYRRTAFPRHWPQIGGLDCVEKMKMPTLVLGAALLTAVALVAVPAASANPHLALALYVPVSSGSCSFASAEVNGVAAFCSNLGQPGCTSVYVASQTVQWCN